MRPISTDRFNRHRPMAPGSALLALLLSACVVRADVVGIAGKPPTIDVKITAFSDGQLEYRLSSQRQVLSPIDTIDYLQITNWPLFNLAEKQQRDGHVRLAAANYERLLKQAAEPEAGELARRQLLRCRWLRTLDQQGRFDQAVEVYLQIIEQEPSLAERLRPTKIPPAGSTFLQAAIKSVNTAIQRHGQDEVGRLLIGWRNTWPSAETRPAASSGPAASRPAGVADADVAWQLAEIQQAVGNGQFDKALKQIDAILDRSPEAANADIFFWQGKASLGRSGDGKTEEAKRDRVRAGLAFMRVVIHFPGHALAPQSLYEAGEICRLEGRREQAIGLWTELVRSYPTATEWTARARQGLEKNREAKAAN